MTLRAKCGRLKRRLQVRDPRAGILSDWFGIENSGALIAAALYEQGGTAEDLARRTGVAFGNIRSTIVRLRRAGLDIPPASKWHSTYVLGPETRAEVRKAFDNAVDLLGASRAELEGLRDRVMVLEDALGLSIAAPRQYGLTRTQSELYGLLCKASVLTRERIMVALYGHRNDPPAIKAIDVMIFHLRRKLAPHGLEIVTHLGVGYELRRAMKAAA